MQEIISRLQKSQPKQFFHVNNIGIILYIPPSLLATAVEVSAQFSRNRLQMHEVAKSTPCALPEDKINKFKIRIQLP